MRNEAIMRISFSAKSYQVLRQGILSLLALGLVNPAVGYAQQTQRADPEEYSIGAVRIGEEIRIDGLLDEPQWLLATPATGFAQFEPEEGEPATEKTEVRVLYDDHNLYLGVRCWDREPDKIVANELRRDAELGHNDMVGIMLDTFHDHRNGFGFCFNPLGTKQDGLITDEGRDKNFNWDGVWHCKATIDSLGWAAEVSIPFKTLRFKEKEEQTWGMNIMRSIRRKNEFTFWTPVYSDYGVNADTKFSQFGHLTGLQGLRRRRTLQLKPYILGGLERDYEAGETERRFDAGLDLKYGITSDLTADLTINTDFAQVESDQEQINLQRFSLFFPEKREFFLEGAGTFYLGEKLKPWEGRPFASLFFSRRIGLAEETAPPILGGARITGKVGRNSVGLLDLQVGAIEFDDEGTTYIVPSTNFGALRLKRDIFGSSNVGLIFLNKWVNATARQRERVENDSDTYFYEEFENSYNRSLGLDLNFSTLRSLNFGGFLAKTYTPEATGKDWAGNLYLDWRNDLFSFDGSHMQIGENFNPEMGFLLRDGIRRTKLEFGYSPRPPIALIRQSFFFFNNRFLTDRENVLLTRSNSIGGYNSLENGGHLMIGFNQSYEKLTQEDEFEMRENMLIEAGDYSSSGFFSEFGSDPGRMLSADLEFNGGGFFGGGIVGLDVGGSFRPNPKLSISSSVSQNWVKDLPVLDLVNYEQREIDFATTLVAGRIGYSFSSNLFSRAFLQYNSDDKEYSANILLNCIYRPGSDLYLVYNELWGENGVTEVKDRVIILKIAHLLSI